MTQKAFLTVVAVIYVVFGLGFYLTPEMAGGNFGLKFEPAGILHTRILGSALIGFGIAYWAARNVAPNPTLRGLLWGSCIYNVLDMPWLIMALTTGLLSPTAWIAFALHILLAVGFASFASRPVSA